MKKKIVAAMVAFSVATVGVVGVQQAQAFNLGSLLGGVLKVGGVNFVIDKYAYSINGFLNNLLKQNNLSTTYSTKVVPIVSLGGGAHIGAAQVTGPSSEVERVEAVAQIEASFNSVARVKGLVPIDSKNPSTANRIQGVGISAIIDLKI